MPRHTTTTAGGAGQSREARAVAAAAVMSLLVGASGLAAAGVALGLRVSSPPPLANALRATEHATTTPGVRFEMNAGQVDSQVRFFTHGGGQTLYLTDTQAVMVVGHPAPPPTRSKTSHAKMPTGKTAVVRMDMVGANPHPAVNGVDQLPGITNYFIGNNPAQWHTNIPSYGAVQYTGVWPGVDAVYHSSQAGELEYDFVLAPAVDPSTIMLRFSGADRVAVDGGGNLVLITGGGEVVQRAPTVYQINGVSRVPVTGGYVMRDATTVGFTVGAHDSSLPVVIDPSLSYSTFVGGGNGAASGADGAALPTAITVDSAGNAYVTGGTTSPSFPTTLGVVQPAPSNPYGGFMAYVSKLNPTGSAFVYSTYLGGNHTGAPQGDVGFNVGVDAAGNLYVTGSTLADSSFPTTPGALQTGCPCDSFASKLNPAGSRLLYSTYLPGNFPVGQNGGQENYSAPGSTMALDGGGNTYLLLEPASGSEVLKLNSSGSKALYTFPIAAGTNAIALDASRNAYVAGLNGSGETFVTKVNAAGTQEAYNFAIAGSNNGSVGTWDFPNALAVDGSGNAYVTGLAVSTTFPTTAGAFQRTREGGSDVFVAKVNASGTALVYSTFVGGTGAESPGWIAVDSAGDAYITGNTSSVDYPAVEPVEAPQPAFGVMGFVTEVNPAGSALDFSTPLGGDLQDSTVGIALDAAGSIYVSGDTYSLQLPTTSTAAQSAFPNDAVSVGFAIKLGATAAGAPSVRTVSPSTGSFSGGTAVTITGTGFTGATAVSFGGLKATHVKVHSASKITATSPPTTLGTLVQDTVSVTVTTPSGTSGAGPISDFTYGQGDWLPTGSAGTVRYNAVAAELPNGKVLVAGGATSASNSDCGTLLASAELYDPVTGRWSPTGSMVDAVCQATATLLPTGKVLVAGGNDASGVTNVAQLYDPTTGTWAATTSMNQARIGHTATLLQSGKVLVAGYGGTAEVYDPAAATWTPTGPMVADRNHYAMATATLIPNGWVVVTGGCCNPDYSGNWTMVEVYDPGSNTWFSNGSLALGRTNAVAALLPNGNVLIAGGYDTSLFPVASAEEYNPRSETSSLAGVMSLGRLTSASASIDGGADVLIVDGNGLGTMSSSEIYNFARQAFVSGGRTNPSRGTADYPTDWAPPLSATLITGTFAQCGVNCGKVLVTGGSGDTSAELYSPQPFVTGVSPNSGSHTGGTTVTITGTGLASVTQVLFGTAKGVNIVHDPTSPDTKLTVVTPPHSTGTIDITVSGAGGTSTKSFADLFKFT